MRVRFIKDYQAYRAGEIAELTNGQELIARKLAMQDKSEDGAAENKITGPTENKGEIKQPEI